MASGAVVGVSRRLRQLVRPLDSVTRIGTGQFAVIAHLRQNEDCESLSRRIHEGINLKAFKTQMGFANIKGCTTICSADTLSGLPEPLQLLKHTSQEAQKNTDNHAPRLIHWKAHAAVGS